jgi:hypothetical protein
VRADQQSSLGSGQQRKFTPKWEGACFPLQKYLPTSSKTAAIPGYSGYRRRESIDYEIGRSKFSGFSSEIRRQAHEQKRELGGLLVAQSAAAVSPRTLNESVSSVASSDLAQSAEFRHSLTSRSQNGPHKHANGKISKRAWADFVHGPQLGYATESTHPFMLGGRNDPHVKTEAIPGYQGVRRLHERDGCVGFSQYNKEARDAAVKSRNRARVEKARQRPASAHTTSERSPRKAIEWGGKKGLVYRPSATRISANRTRSARTGLWDSPK